MHIEIPDLSQPEHEYYICLRFRQGALALPLRYVQTPNTTHHLSHNLLFPSHFHLFCGLFQQCQNWSFFLLTLCDLFLSTRYSEPNYISSCAPSSNTPLPPQFIQSKSQSPYSVLQGVQIPPLFAAVILSPSTFPFICFSRAGLPAYLWIH